MLIFKDPKNFLSPESEKKRYKEHNNQPDNKGYVNFLSKALEPTLPFLKEAMSGLDFGCGPNPVLASMIKKKGFECDHYDPFFYPELPDERKEFIFATECFEHFFNPANELQLISSLLCPSGTITIMTNQWDESTDFNSWYYLKDNTHIAFYHSATFDFICKKFGFSKEYDDGESVVVLSKNVVHEPYIEESSDITCINKKQAIKV
ncbi:class I SAM-dependent methyltransferase [Marinilabiliaceae bacterium ANBcel2]|nr:class I SAM-dependent methyltransferase [Marinilabiliaceae bacterium ANBcel2]